MEKKQINQMLDMLDSLSDILIRELEHRGDRLGEDTGNLQNTLQEFIIELQGVRETTQFTE